MNKDIGIITLYDLNNYGNRLQNYAVASILKKMNYNSESVLNVRGYDSVSYKIKNVAKYIIQKRYRAFCSFNKNIKLSDIKIDNCKALSKKKVELLNQKYDFFITGSDQVWNPTLKRYSRLELLHFVPSQKRIAFSASFGIDELPNKFKDDFKNEIKAFKSISVREDVGKKIIQDDLGIEADVEVLVDPTMLLTAAEWDNVSKKPKQYKGQKYILNYFLGDLEESKSKEIKKVAEKNGWIIINILDKNDSYYCSGPAEFLWLEKNAELICTDSFHSSVFSILYNRPFIIFEREQKGLEKMNSRLNTLLSKFKLENRRFTGKISDELLKCDYSQAKEILESEQKKSMNFLRDALDI